jgi:hypothetical protein
MKYISFFFEELRWRRIVRKDILARYGEEDTPSFGKLRIIILMGFIFLYLIPPFLFSRLKSRYLVGFYLNENANFYKKYGVCGDGLTDLIGGKALFEFFAIYYLIHYKKIFPQRISKILLYLFIKKIEIFRSSYKNRIFILNQDYFGRSSILVSMQKVINLNLLGLQHGLMPFKNLHCSNAYPGMRLKFQCAYSKRYVRQFSRMTNPNGASIKFLGPPFSAVAELNSQEIPTSLLYVSNSTLNSRNSIDLVLKLKAFAKADNLNFFIRPHPHEINLLNYKKLYSESEVQFKKKTTNLILIGFYSSLMYWAAFNGYKTIWVRSDVISNFDELEITSWPNTSIVDQENLSSTFISRVVRSQAIPTCSSNLEDRLDRIIKKHVLGNFD